MRGSSPRSVDIYTHIVSHRDGRFQWPHEKLEPNFPSTSSSHEVLRHVGVQSYCSLLEFCAGNTLTLMECIADVVKMGGKFGAFWELSGDLLHPLRKYLSMGPGSLWSVLSGEKS